MATRADCAKCNGCALVNLIEYCFEKGTGMTDVEDVRLHEQALMFFSCIEGNVSAENRMRLIMRNIIANRGTFDPSKQPKRLPRSTKK